MRVRHLSPVLNMICSLHWESLKGCLFIGVDGEVRIEALTDLKIASSTSAAPARLLEQEMVPIKGSSNGFQEGQSRYLAPVP